MQWGAMQLLIARERERDDRRALPPVHPFLAKTFELRSQYLPCFEPLSSQGMNLEREDRSKFCQGGPRDSVDRFDPTPPGGRCKVIDGLGLSNRLGWRFTLSVRFPLDSPCVAMRYRNAIPGRNFGVAVLLWCYVRKLIKFTPS